MATRSPESENNRRNEQEPEEGLQLSHRRGAHTGRTKTVRVCLDIPFHVQTPRKKKHPRILGHRAARDDRPNEKRSRRRGRRRNVFRRQTQTQINDRHAGDQTDRA